MNSLLKFILSILFLPILLTIDLFKSDRSIIRKIGYLFIILIFFLSTWIQGYTNLISATRYVMWEVGIMDKLSDVHVSGQSMLPTILDGAVLSLHNPKKFGIERGDIVSFQNIETGASYYIKRVIGLEGEEIILKNGQVYIDNQVLSENYIYQDSPTYGNTFLSECQTYEIPKGKVAVFGDNRIASTDSRVIGFIDKKDIEGVIKTDIKPSFSNVAKDVQLELVTLNSTLFIEKLNEKRTEKNLGPLLSHVELDNAAQTRANLIADDYENWKNIEETATALLDKTEYEYLLAQEIITFGNFNEDQLVEHVLELHPYSQDFLSDRYYDIGIGFSNTLKGECKIPIIVILISWPTHPNYSQELIDNWNKNIDSLTEAISTLKSLKSNPNINNIETQELIDELSSLLDQAHQLRAIIISNEWATEGETINLENFTGKSQNLQQKLSDFVRKYSQFIDDPSFNSFVSEYKWGNVEFNIESDNAALLFSQGKYDELLESSTKLTMLATNDDENAIAYYWEGLAYYNLGRSVSATLSLEKAVELNTEYAAPYVTLSAISFNDGKFQEGLAYAIRCAELDPDYGWCYNNLGLAYYFLGDIDRGITELERAVSLDPTSYVFNDNLKRMKDEKSVN